MGLVRHNRLRRAPRLVSDAPRLVPGAPQVSPCAGHAPSAVGGAGVGGGRLGKGRSQSVPIGFVPNKPVNSGTRRDVISFRLGRDPAVQVPFGHRSYPESN